MMHRLIILIVVVLTLVGCHSEPRYPAQCGAPLPGWKKPADGYGVLAITNKVRVVRDGTTRWNSMRVTRDKLAEYADLLRHMNPTPFTILEIEPGAQCGDVIEARRIIDQHAKCRATPGFGVCGEGAGPWALIGDVIGPNGETTKFYPEPPAKKSN